MDAHERLTSTLIACPHRLRSLERPGPSAADARDLRAPESRDFASLVRSDAGKAFLDGAWAWYGLILVLLVFSILGEELLFRGFLLPRMHRAFGRGDWVANGLIFTVYHLHVPWAMPATLLETFLIACPTKRYRSAWIGAAVHGSQSVFFAILILLLVV